MRVCANKKNHSMLCCLYIYIVRSKLLLITHNARASIECLLLLLLYLYNGAITSQHHFAYLNAIQNYTCALFKCDGFIFFKLMLCESFLCTCAHARHLQNKIEAIKRAASEHVFAKCDTKSVYI